MKGLKRFIALALAIVSCATAMSVTAFAATAEPAYADFTSTSYNSPTNTFSKWQCTWYAFGRTHEKLGMKLTYTSPANAGDWLTKITDSRVIKRLGKNVMISENSIAVFPNHVVFVENIVDTGLDLEIYYTEANYTIDHAQSADDGHEVMKTESQFRNAFGGLKGIIALE